MILDRIQSSRIGSTFGSFPIDVPDTLLIFRSKQVDVIRSVVPEIVDGILETSQIIFNQRAVRIKSICDKHDRLYVRLYGEVLPVVFR